QWKLDVALFSWRSRMGKQKHQVVQHRHQIVGGIADENAEQRRDRFDVSELGNEPAMSILLKNESVEVRCQKIVGNRLSRIEVFLRPPELPPQIIQFIRHALDGA